MNKTIDERIEALERKMVDSTVAGTTISRVLQEKKGVEWCLALGGMQLPKDFFYGSTIEECLDKAEESYE